MSTIMDKIAGHTRFRVAEKKKKLPLEELRARALDLSRNAGETLDLSADAVQSAYAVMSAVAVLPADAAMSTDKVLPADASEEFPFRRALSAPGIQFICECKKASPSKGLIAPDFPYLDIALAYEAAGAAAISVLTEPRWFRGEDRFLQEIARTVKIPCLRKDFTVDSYMIYEAKILGASAVLLICAILDDGELREYLSIAHELGLSALVEAHDEEEICRALDAGAGIIGVNNRDLRTFTVDINNSVRLRSLVPDDKIYVSESGIRNAEDVEVLYRNRTDAVLIGETLMRNPDKAAGIRALRSRCI